MRLAITGAGGIVGRGIAPYLRNRFDLVLIDRKAPDNSSPQDTWVISDIQDRAALDQALEGVDAVLHLAAVHGFSISFEETLDANYRGTISVYDAAVAAGAKHLIFASSNHGWGFRQVRQTPLSTTTPVAPDGWYGIAKMWGEAVTAYYAEAFGLHGTSLRIGHANDHVPTAREGHMWISFRDLAGLIRQVIEAPAKGHRALWATAICDAPYFDNAETLGTGWAPLDRPGSPVDSAPAPISEDDIGGAFARANRRK